MTDASTLDSRPPEASWRARAARWRHDWEIRLRRFAAPEAMLGLAVMVLAAVSATITTGSPVVMGLAVIGGACVHLVAVESGNHSLGWLASSLVLVFAVAAGERLVGDLPPVGYTVPSLLSLVHSELLNLGHARRRSSSVDPSVYRSVGLGLAAVGACSVIGIGLAQRLDTGDERSWLWLLAGAALVGITAVLLTWIPARRPNTVRGRRWRPGDRLPPVPLSELEIDPTVGAGPTRR